MQMICTSYANKTEMYACGKQIIWKFMQMICKSHVNKLEIYASDM